MKTVFTFLLCTGLFCFISAQGTATLFSDDFETSSNWTIFEEIVSGNACYGNNIGEVAASTDKAYGGSHSLRVWSNKGGSTQSNHVIAAHHISNTSGITGRLRYGVWAYCATPIGLTQSGPEFSVQSTRTVGAQNLTYIAGIQYIGNQWITDKWNIWHNGTWKAIKITEFNTSLAVDTWYYLELDFDMTTNKYISFKIQGGGINTTLDLTQSFQNATNGFEIGGEARNWTPSYFVTTESENLWTTCSQVRENKVYYDNVSLQSVSSILPIELTSLEGFRENNTNRIVWQFSDKSDLESLEIQKSNDGRNFMPLSTLNPNDTYFIDNQPFKTSYYRLKMVDLKNKISYSKIISLSEEAIDTQGFEIYPNPTHDDFTIKILSPDVQTLECYDILGRLVFSKRMDTPQYKTHFSIQNEGLKSGTYFLKANKGKIQKWVIF